MGISKFFLGWPLQMLWPGCLAIITFVSCHYRQCCCCFYIVVSLKGFLKSFQAGFLYITGRIKGECLFHVGQWFLLSWTHCIWYNMISSSLVHVLELIITAGGENMAPVPIEHQVKEAVPFISNVMLIGDKRKFISCLITLKVTITYNICHLQSRCGPLGPIIQTQA